MANHRLLLGLLGALAIGWAAGRGRLEEAHAAQAQAAPSGQGVIALRSDGADGAQWLYLIDPNQQVISVYEFSPKRSKLKLVSVRQYSADHQLAEYNNEAPQVADIEELVRKQ